ncbi:S-adenosyl-L-methionine-dependent methyltransferase [Exidia glandulosa HHB12029]|uniref:Protein-lysine N-methyltransferase EFM4 n=1 Tax=Exidia glandulosa HHB12029 TaxID=1314781 RepID=A0A165L6J5_EXIGL|nr:S-adenosyl-L-methionine-dependent methyltransferase [Exidia glandulosa HHB12029]
MAEDFAPSKLGTKAHWDSVYKEEVDNFEELGDEGEVWFGTETVEKMVEWTAEHVPASPAPYILDIGTGNGVMLFSLAEEGYDASRMLGVDYSEDSVRLAKLVANARERSDVTFAQGDFLKDDPPHVQGMEDGKVDVWDLLLDKGTYDAIGLAGKDEDGVRPRDVYPGRVARLLKPGGLFLITSCNYTEEELKAAFETADTGLTYHSRIQHPTYTYGGKSGSICASVAFRKPAL